MASLLALVVTGCSDDVTGLGDEFDATAVARVVTDVSGVELQNTAAAHIPIVTQALRQSIGVGAALVPKLDLPGVAFSPRQLEATRPGVRYSLTGGGTSAILPASHHGKTFVLAEIGGWMIDEERTDAPVDGVRFVLYELDPYTGRPKLIPPQPIGHMDFVEEAGTSSPRLRVLAKKTSGGNDTLLDFYLEGYSVLTEGGAETVFSSAGSVLAKEQVDYSLEDSIIFSDGFQQADVYFARDLNIPAENRSVTLVMDGELRASEVDPGFVQVMLTVTDGPVTAVMDVIDDGFTVVGDITYNGQTVVLISGDPFDPTFTNPDGTALTEADEQAVWEIFTGADLLLLFGDQMLAPLSLLFP
jgi:hypothetical protein